MLNPSELSTHAHIWYCCLDAVDMTEPAAFESQLSPEEFERYQRFRFERDRSIYLIAHVMLRQVLTYYSGLSSDDIEFERNRYGRPELVASGRLASLRFNLSHTRGLIAVILTANADCGVDVEHSQRMNDIDAISSRFFAKAETESLLSLPDEKRSECFFQFWTLKEAYIKAKGMGLAIPLGKFGFTILNADNITVQFDQDLQDCAESWQFGLMTPVTDFQLAWAIKHDGQPLQIKTHHFVPVAVPCFVSHHLLGEKS